MLLAGLSPAWCWCSARLPPRPPRCPAPRPTTSPRSRRSARREADTTRPRPALGRPGERPDLRELGGGPGEGALSNPLALVLLLGSLSFLPAVLIMTTAFTRIVIVLGFTRSALGTQGVPPNQVLIGLALFLTMFVMAPVFSQINDDALQPYLKGTITRPRRTTRGIEPLRGVHARAGPRPGPAAVRRPVRARPTRRPRPTSPTTTLVPAFVISELRTAFLIGFVVFIPFVVIDLVVSAALSAMGMAMLPPSLISLPFKLLLFVAVDGWYLLGARR